MGLDLNPMSKPMPGHEDECRKLFNKIMSFSGERDMTPELMRFQAITLVPHGTAGIPRVGHDDVATEFARAQFAEADDPGMTEEEYLEEAHGAWLPDLAPDSDAFPPWSNHGLGLASRFSFRGEFIVADEIRSQLDDPDGITAALYEPMLADDLAQLGEKLTANAERIAREHGVEAMLADRDVPDDTDDDDPRQIVHVLASAGRWAAWWSSRGHGMEPDY